MESLVLLLVVGVISLINWAIKKTQEKSAYEEASREAAADRAERHAARRARAPRAEDPMRELMEALGLPRDAVAPVPLAPRPEPEEFASLEEPPQSPRIQFAADAKEPDQQTRSLASAMEASRRRAPQEDKSSWRSLLAGREAQRRAFVAGEILGSPRGLAGWR